jgi:leucyl/phenylalanyl-tRNA---protein transferase
VLDAYRRGIIPFPARDEYSRDFDEFRYEDKVAEGVIAIVGYGQADLGGADLGGADPYSVAWWSPDPRPVIRVQQVHIGRNVRKRLRHGLEWTTTANHSFQRVAEECRHSREPRWLTNPLLESLLDLHQLGWAHSVEVWEGDDLVGGAFGIAVGTTFSGDSMFNRRPDAARVAVADLAARFAQAGGVAIDAQWDSPFLRSLGAEPMPRERYLSMLAAGSANASRPLALPSQPLPARRLIALAAT